LLLGAFVWKRQKTVFKFDYSVKINLSNIMNLIGNRKKSLFKTMVVCGFISAVGVSSLFAQTNTDNLADLAANGGSLTIGDKIFSGFTFGESGLTGFNASAITVTASEVGGNYFLTWGGSVALFNGTANTSVGDLLLDYTVTATDGEIFAIDQNYTGAATPGSFISVAETANVPGNATIVASSYLNDTITSTSYTATGAVLTPAQPILDVTKDIAIGAAPGGFISISQVEQSFEQIPVPEPTTLALAGLSGLSLLLFRRQRK
jgi:hypothetical protein